MTFAPNFSLSTYSKSEKVSSKCAPTQAKSGNVSIDTKTILALTCISQIYPHRLSVKCDKCAVSFCIDQCVLHFYYDY